MCRLSVAEKEGTLINYNTSYVVREFWPYPRNKDYFQIDGRMVNKNNSIATHRYGGSYNDYLILTSNAARPVPVATIRHRIIDFMGQCDSKRFYSVPPYAVLHGNQIIFPHHTIFPSVPGLELRVNRNQCCFMDLVPRVIHPNDNEEIPHLILVINAPLCYIWAGPGEMELTSLGKDPDEYEGAHGNFYSA